MQLIGLYQFIYRMVFRSGRQFGSQPLGFVFHMRISGPILPISKFIGDYGGPISHFNGKTGFIDHDRLLPARFPVLSAGTKYELSVGKRFPFSF